MKLVLVESPTKAKKIGQYLGTAYKVEASVGHIRDLPKKKMGIAVDNDFEPEYELAQGKKALVAQLKKLVKSADQVILATDPDREGEAIAWHLQELLATKSGPDFVRSTFFEITKPAVLAAIEAPTGLNLDLVSAQKARRILDRLVGYYLSPVLWKKVRRGLSAGRVQSVALRLIVERELEIRAFKPDEYWEISADLLGSEKPFTAQLQKIDQDGVKISSEQEVVPHREALRDARYTLAKIDQTQRERVSLPPFTTSTMQQAAATRLGWGAKMTMSIAQQLYEEGLITYHRTDSLNLSQQSIEQARETILKQFGSKYLPESPRYFKKTSKNAQEAHEAIRPTNFSVQSPNGLDDRQSKLYQLIWARALASQMSSAVYLQTAYSVEATPIRDAAVKQYLFKANGSILKFDGWRRVIPSGEDTILPDLQEGLELQLQELHTDQKFTQPPARYNDASLIKTLEKLGIGRPSTYASIISVILDRGYVERKEKAFMATAIGEAVSSFLVAHFPQEVDYAFTAEMEDSLDAIARGEKKWLNVIKGFFKPFEEKISLVTETAERVKIAVEETGQVCPDCSEGQIVIRTGRFGKFLSCSRFPECKYTTKYLETVDDLACPTCVEGKVVLKRTRKGRTFYGCSRYPSCTFASWNKPGTESESESTKRTFKKSFSSKKKSLDTVKKPDRTKSVGKAKKTLAKSSSKKTPTKKALQDKVLQ